MILYASDEVISKLAICEREGIDTKTKIGKHNYLDLIEAMKKDIEKLRIIKVIWRGKGK